jgi:integrase/recombinase XerD
MLIEVQPLAATSRRSLSVSALQALRDYLAARAATGAPKPPESSLFVNRRGGALSYVMAEHFLTEVIRHAGLKPRQGRRGPRIHDLRHTFVVHRMLDWYRTGINPQAKLPYLATYLGHKDITSTLTYLNLTPEVLGHASERWRQYGAHALGDVS